MVRARPHTPDADRQFSHDQRMRSFRAALLAVLIAAAPAAVALAAFTPKTVKYADDEGDAADGAPDIVRVTFGRATNGQLRTSVFAADPWKAKDLVAKDGVPGSFCLRLWTKIKAKGHVPDYLVCATASADGKTLNGAVLQEHADGTTPSRVANAAVSRGDDKSVTLRFSQSSVARPDAIDVAAEATKAGCPLVSCTDSAPDAGVK